MRKGDVTMDRIVLTASEGMMLTNGEGFWVKIELGNWDSPENYREIPVEECEAIMQAEAITE